MITSAFTCTGPYAILILLGIKRVENRNAMPMPVKGRCAISCSKSFSREEYGEFVWWASRVLKPEEFETIPAWNDVKDWPGKVVGCCDYACNGRDAPAPGDLSAPRGEDAAELFRLAVHVAGGSEGFFVLPLDEERRVLSEPILVSLGASSVTTVVQPGEVFGAALKANAKAVIVSHNHPSGNMTPSVQDRELTAALKRLGEAMGVAVLDHLVIGGDSFAAV